MIATVGFSKRFALWWLLFGGACVAELLALCWRARMLGPLALVAVVLLSAGSMGTLVLIYYANAHIGERLARIATSITWFLLLTLVVTTLQYYVHG